MILLFKDKVPAFFAFQTPAPTFLCKGPHTKLRFALSPAGGLCHGLFLQPTLSYATEGWQRDAGGSPSHHQVESSGLLFLSMYVARTLPVGGLCCQGLR